jgi:polysaccharide export outer membrane protein
MHSKLLTRILLAALPFLLASCVQHRQLVNFNEGPEFDAINKVIERQAILVRPDDLLEISVQTTDPETSKPFQFNNSINPGSVGTETAANSQIFRVDQNGTIQFPMIGALPVQGLSTSGVRDSLAARLDRYFNAPIINVRLLNFRFSVLGEVRAPGSFTVPNEHTNILEALGMAGDLTNYGNRENILIVRERSGNREFGHLNLHDRSIFQSPYFYLQPGDIVYIEPIKAKVGSTEDGSTKYLRWALPIVSVISIIVSLTR